MVNPYPGHGKISSAAIPEPVRVVFGLGLDYLRWVSLTPMVIAWALFLFMVVFFNFVNVEDSIWDTLERGYEAYSERFGPIAWIEEGEAAHEQEAAVREVDPAAQEPVEFGLDDVTPWIMKVWGIIALAAWLLSVLRTALFGPRPPRPLAGKMRLLAIALLTGWALLFVAYFVGRPIYDGGFFGWFALFTGVALIVGVISVVTLVVGEVIDSMRRWLEPEGQDVATVIR